MTCQSCGCRPVLSPRTGPVDAQGKRIAKCAECRKQTRRENEAVSKAIWGAMWKQRKQEATA